MSMLIPTEEQEAIISAARRARPGSGLMISADAGASKTTTLGLIAVRSEPKPSLAITFGKKATEELVGKLPGFFEVKTMHGLAYGAWSRRVGRKLDLDDRKIGKLVRSVGKEMGLELSEEDWIATRDLVETARGEGLLHLNYEHLSSRGSRLADCEETWLELTQAPIRGELVRLARRVLETAIKMSFLGKVDFEDLIYMSVYFGGIYKQWPKVYVDESQDLNAMNHLQVEMVLRPESNLFVVGDMKQSLYLFRGAHGDSMNALRALRREWIDLPLHTTFRCPTSVVARQQDHAPGYRARDGASTGLVLDWTDEPWRWNMVRALRVPTERIFVVCRNNAPLVRLGLKLAQDGIFAEYLGGDLGRRLISLIKQVLNVKGRELPLISIGEFRTRLGMWSSAERAKTEKPRQLAWIAEREECLLAICDLANARTVRDMGERIENFFESGKRSEDAPVLSTIHRAKGLESELVLHLDPWRIPSSFASSDEELRQEANARYVAETRTKRVLIEADVDDYEGLRR